MKLHFSRAIARDLRSVDVAADESPILASHGVRDRTIQQYLLWRRSWLYLLLPLAFLAATIQMTSFFSETRDLSNFSWFGIIVLGTTFVLQMIGYPIAAALAVWKWDQARFSRWTLIIGWIASFLLPFLVALIPFGDFIVIEETDPDFIVGQKFGAGLVGATFWLFSLLPGVAGDHARHSAGLRADQEPAAGVDRPGVDHRHDRARSSRWCCWWYSSR